MTRNQGFVVALIGVVVLIGLCFWYLGGGYGEVSAETYQYSKALYGACLKKDEAHLNKVEEMVASAGDSIPAKEKAWLDEIISKARAGKWESAANDARRMMDDQVKY